MQLGALGGGYAPTSTEGLGPAISEKQDNGAQETDQFTIDTTQDNQFHGSASSWLPIQTATEQTGATAADTGAGMSDAAYLSDFGKKGPSTASVPGSSLTISAKDDNAGKGETFSISTEQGAFPTPLSLFCVAESVFLSCACSLETRPAKSPARSHHIPS